jgi:hypothetical protein
MGYCLIYVATVLVVTQREAVSLTREQVFPPGIYLVRAVASSPEAPPTAGDARPGARWPLGYPAFYRVTEVYVGPPELQGKTLGGDFATLFHIADFPMGFSSPPTPRARKEPIGGVFWSRNLPKGTRLDDLPKWTGFVLYQSQYPSAMNHDRHYPQAVSACKALKVVYDCGDKDRLSMIDKYVSAADVVSGLKILQQLTKNPKDPDAKPMGLTAELWAFGTNLRNPGVVQYLRSLLARRAELAIAIQMEAEYGLRETTGWSGSDGQRAVVERWFSGQWRNDADKWPRVTAALVLNGPGERSLVHWLSANADDRTFSATQICALAAMGLANPARSEMFKKEVASALRKAAKAYWSAKDRATAFEFLLRQSDEAASGPERVASARLLAVAQPFSPAQDAEIRKALGRARESAIADLLRHYLQR